MKTRIYKWDNVKCLLIFSVVLGHFTNQFAKQSVWMRSISIFIYSFHMPLFIFLSGLLQKKWEEEDRLDWSKPLYYVILGYILKCAIYVIKLAFHKNPVFCWFGDTGLPWYMFAMAAFMVITYVLRKADWRIVLPLWIAAACAAGYVNWIGSFLYLSRIIVFFPFYYMGYHLKNEDVMEYVNLSIIKLLSAVVIAVVGYISFFRINEVYSYIRLLTGRNAYAFIHVPGIGWEHRLVFYGLAICMSVAVMSLVPNGRHPVAEYIGQHTLQIYFWHRLVLYVIMYSKVTTLLMNVLEGMWIYVFLLGAIVLTVMLSWNCFGYPLTFLRKEQKRVVHALAHVF